MVANSDDRREAIARFKPGAKRDVEIHRGGETKMLKV